MLLTSPEPHTTIIPVIDVKTLQAHDTDQATDAEVIAYWRERCREHAVDAILDRVNVLRSRIGQPPMSQQERSVALKGLERVSSGQ